MSQLLNLANIRPGGRYLVVDDTGGLVTAALLDRMACEGKIITFTDSDSPPAWGVLDTMNFSAQQLECVKSLSWMEADEDYVKRKCGWAGYPTCRLSQRLRQKRSTCLRLRRSKRKRSCGNTWVRCIDLKRRGTTYTLETGTGGFKG